MTDFHWSSGIEMPSDLESYKLIVHCSACLINRWKYYPA
ncbi:hypothetical protein [Desulfoscipio gibsoniae]|nr:hypothetical protein [Desulfoscipio gibsoniae]